MEGIFECFVVNDFGGLADGAEAVLLLMSEGELLMTTADRGRRALKSSQWAAVHGKREKKESLGLELREKMMERVILKLDSSKEVRRC